MFLHGPSGGLTELAARTLKRVLNDDSNKFEIHNARSSCCPPSAGGPLECPSPPHLQHPGDAPSTPGAQANADHVTKCSAPSVPVVVPHGPVLPLVLPHAVAFRSSSWDSPSPVAQRAELSSLFCSARARYLATTTRGSEPSPASTWGLQGDHSASIEYFAGVGTLSSAFAHRGSRVAVLCEQSRIKQRVNAAHHPTAVPLADADLPCPIPAESIIHFSAGLPCQPVAPSGARRANLDYRARFVTESVPNAVLRLQQAGKLVFLEIEEHADFITVGRDMLALLRTNLLALPTPIVLSAPDFFSPRDHGGPILRRRCAIRGEPVTVCSRIGEPPPLRPMRYPRRRIIDIALPDADVRDEQYLEGAITLVPHAVSDTFPTVAGHIVCGGPSASVVVGSRVRIDNDSEVDLVVMSFTDVHMRHVELFHDSRDSPWFLRSVAVSRITEHLSTIHSVLSMEGLAASCTRVGVPPLGPSKQLWLRNGRAYRPDWRELIQLMDGSPDHLSPLRLPPEPIPHDDIDSIVGDMLSFRMADAMADRSVTRSLQYLTAMALDASTANGLDVLETRAAQYFKPITYLDQGDVAIAFVAVRDGALRILVAGDLLQLPVAVHSGSPLPRDSAVNLAERLAAVIHQDERKLHGFLVHSTDDLTVVAFPLPHESITYNLDPVLLSVAVWASLDDVAMSPLYVPAASAFARVAAHCQHGVPVPHRHSILDGATRATPVLTLPYAPSAIPSAWPSQLALLESIDTHLRRVINAVSATNPHKPYLSTWVDQVDTSHNADIPFNVRGLCYAEFDNPALVDLSFSPPMPTPTLPAPVYPPPQVTAYRPMSLRDILMLGSIRKLADAVRAIVDALKFIQRGEEIPVRIRRRLAPVVIGQEGFLPSAQGIIWDLRTKHPDGYYLPLDFSAPLPTHLNTSAYFDALGDDYPDQSLRHQVKYGALFFADLDLQIVVCPHLLSLADGFANVDKELRRLRSLGYVEFNNNEESAFVRGTSAEGTVDVQLVIVAFGILPCRCTPQGTRARKLEPDRPRRISDCGAPRKTCRDGSGTVVSSLNDAIGFKSCLRDGTQKFPTESKPRLQTAMRDNAVLQSAARVWREPVLLFNDDTKDCFNQMFLHPSEIWKTSVLWLKLSEIASECQYTHVIEHVFGYGIGNASGFAQRFGNSLLALVARRMDEVDAPFLAAEAAASPSCAAWLARRREITLRTGHNEERLYSCFIYTDDPVFQCVGFSRFIRLLTCWREVTTMVGLRMAIAAKRQAGSSVLWTGLRLHGTFGVASIPPSKRTRAIAELKRVAAGNKMRLDDAQSLAGLLEHLLPWAGELRAAMYHFYYPHRAFAGLGPQHPFFPTDAMQDQAGLWISRLIERPGISVLAHVIPNRPPSHSGSLLVMSSDAAKSGTPTPGVGGYMHGQAWYLPLLPRDLSGPTELPINVLEFVAIFGNFATFGSNIPSVLHCRLLALTDSLTSALIVANHSARAPLMQLVHLRLLALRDFRRLSPVTEIAHIYGPANAMADAVSRGYFDTLGELCAQLRVALLWLPPHASVIVLLEDLRAAVDGSLSSHPPTPPDPGRDEQQHHQRPLKFGKRFSSDITGDGQAYYPPPSPPPPAPRAPVLPSRARMLGPFRPPRGVALTPSLPSPRDVSRLASYGPPLPDRQRDIRASASSHHADFAWARNPPPPPPSHHVARVSLPARESSLVEALTQDGSRFRLCPRDPSMLTALVRDVHSTPELAVPRTTAAKDRSAWKKWVAFCRILGTPEWRDCPDAHDGHDRAGRRRECFIQAAFLLWAYRTMVPRNRSHQLPKPASARACLDAVRRVHRHNDIIMCPAPSISRLVTGLLAEYIRVHGPESLIPSRREPLTNPQTSAILGVGHAEPVRVGNRIVDWEASFWVSFAAFLTTLRHSGSRKADLLDHTAADFNAASMTRRNLKWRIRGVTYDSPPAVALRDLRVGDCAILLPGCTKSDPFALHFGDRPMYLPFLPDDPTNAAFRLQQLELLCPVPASSRRRSPLFCSDDTSRSLTHAQADDTFNALATLALGPAVAMTLSLHSGRVWLASALLALHSSDATIQAMVRWLCPESIRTYAHMEPAEYEKFLLSAISAPITSRLSRNLPTIDADDCVAHLSDAVAGFSDWSPVRRPLARLHTRARASPPPTPPRDSSRQVLNFDDEDDDDAFDCEVEASGLCDAGHPIGRENIAPGGEVAVPFRLNGSEVHYAGRVVRPASTSSSATPQWDVSFPDGDVYVVRHDRLFAVLELGSHSPASAPRQAF